MTDYALSGVAQSPSGEAQPYLPHVTRRVPRSVHAKFHADWTKTVGARGKQTDKQTDRATLIILIYIMQRFTIRHIQTKHLLQHCNFFILLLSTILCRTNSFIPSYKSQPWSRKTLECEAFIPIWLESCN